jgi:deazaflavin-dependent oxidoreductase (nitroreductase family)
MASHGSEAITRALHIGDSPRPGQRTIDITTIGARTGLPRRIEISFWQVGERFYLGSGPGPRSWYANLLKNPEFTVHFTHGTRADVPATASSVSDLAVRRRVFSEILRQAGQVDDVDAWVRDSPLVEFSPN